MISSRELKQRTVSFRHHYRRRSSENRPGFHDDQ